MEGGFGRGGLRRRGYWGDGRERGGIKEERGFRRGIWGGGESRGGIEKGGLGWGGKQEELVRLREV